MGRGFVDNLEPLLGGMMDEMELYLKKCGWIQEYKFHPVRKWRFDWANPQSKIAIEINGGVWTGGRHTSGSGFIKDMEKINASQVLGWKVLQYTPSQFKDGLPLGDIDLIENYAKKV